MHASQDNSFMIAKFAKFAKSYFVIDVWRPRAALIHRSHRTHCFASKSILSRLACLEEICPTQDTLRSTDVIYMIDIYRTVL